MLIQELFLFGRKMDPSGKDRANTGSRMTAYFAILRALRMPIALYGGVVC